MLQRLCKYFKTLLAVALITSLVSGCGSPSGNASYPLESVSQDGSQVSKVFRAENKTVPQVAQELADQRTPQEVSKEDPERMFLIYPEEWYHLQQDPNRPQDTIIEVDNKEFVRQNYDLSFLEGYLLGSVINDWLDSIKGNSGNYRGYTNKDKYSSNISYHSPTSEEKKVIPPLTVNRTGSITKRGDKPGPFSNGDNNTIGSGGSSNKKDSETSPPSTDGTGTITKRPGESSVSGGFQPKKGSNTFTPPFNNSPPKTRAGGFGKVTKRK